MGAFSNFIVKAFYCAFIMVFCSISTKCLMADEKIGAYGSACTVNSDCQVGTGIVCLDNKCSCDGSYFYDNNGHCKKICRGTSDGLMGPGDFDDLYMLYRNRYTNCSYVYGNLEITSLEGPYDLGFLKDVEEVDGYLLIVNVFSNYLNLTKLRIIRGNELFPFKDKNYSMYIALNHNPKNDSQGLLELQFKSLTEIVKGQVYFHNNNLLCFTNTILWEDINPNTYPHFQIVFDSPNYKRQCPTCPTECYNPVTKSYHCWGSSTHMCQKLNLMTCNQSCNGRCFGSEHHQCCHPACAAGCTGPGSTDCLACKNVYNNRECVASCPKMRIYGSEKWEDNPDGRYSIGSRCVRECPNYLEKDNGACVIRCREGQSFNKTTNECEDCRGTCLKRCKGNSQEDFLHRDNIESFRGCTIVDGNLKILKVSFNGHPHRGIKGINVADLQILRDIKEITGFLAIQEAPPDVKDLSFLSGLEMIHGRYLSTGKAITVLKMEIDYLGLASLQHISNGGVLIALNPRLCYMHNLDMSPIFTNPGQTLQMVRNRNHSECEAFGQTCDSRCSHIGCWGPGIANCLRCENNTVTANNTCLGDCRNMSLVFEGKHNCPIPCHVECKTGCSGPQPEQCFECRNVKILERCLPECPPMWYSDENGICRQCNTVCAKGCTGPSTRRGAGGCTDCFLSIKQTQTNIPVRCIPKYQGCPTGYFEEILLSSIRQVCAPCDPRCQHCNGPGSANCLCPENTVLVGKECRPCHHQCLGSCSGVTYNDCERCHNFKIMINEEKRSFSCVERCPEHLPHHVVDSTNTSKGLCVSSEDTTGSRTERNNCINLQYIVYILVPLAVLMFASLVIATCCWLRRRRRRKLNMVAKRTETLKLKIFEDVSSLAEEVLITSC